MPLVSLNTLKKVALKANSPEGRRVAQKALLIGKRVAKNPAVKNAVIGAAAKVSPRASDFVKTRIDAAETKQRGTTR